MKRILPAGLVILMFLVFIPVASSADWTGGHDVVGSASAAVDMVEFQGPGSFP